MSLQTPTTNDIKENIVAQLQIALNQTIPLLPKSFTRVLATAIAGVFVTLYKYGGFIGLIQLVKTAPYTDTTLNGRVVNPLIEWGRLSGVGDPDPATQAELRLTVVVDTAGETVPSGTILRSSDNNYTYSATETVLLTAPSVTLDVRAAGDPNQTGGLGADGNLPDGAELSFVNPIAGAGAVTVDSTLVSAANIESEDAYRQRIETYFATPPQGGAYADYRIWATTVEGIINAYPYTGANPGEIDVYAEATVASSGSPDGIPTGPQLLAVDTAIQLDEDGLATRRPVGAAVNVLAITRSGFNVEITNLVVPGSLAEVQGQIETALTLYLLEREPYIIGLDLGIRKDRVTATAIGGVVNDVVAAAGGTFDSLTVEELDTTPVVNYQLGQGEKAKLGVVTYV